MTLHFIMIFRSVSGTKHTFEAHTLTGDDIVARMGTIIKTTCQSWADEWELVSVSHTFLPFKANSQIG